MSGNEYEKERERFEAEAKQRWGKTDSYREYREKTQNYGKEDYKRAQNSLEEVFKDFGKAAGEECSPEEPRLKELVKRLQKCISENYYTCTDEILKGLGSMYVQDERFRKNLDGYGKGTAELISLAIESYLRSKE